MALRVSKISQKFFKVLKKNKFIKEKSFVISLSGGSDSLALAALAKAYSYEKKNISLLRFN